MEDILADSGLDWTVVRPPQLTGKPLTGTYRIAYGRNIRGGWSVPRADVAHLMLARARPAPARSTRPSESQADRRKHVTTKDPAVSAAAAIDFTMMYVTHDAFRRDLGRLKVAARAGTAQAPGVRAGWENFKAQPSSHHSVEDTDLWPRVSRAAAARPSGLALLAEMAAEHAQIDPLLAAVDDALAHSPSNLAAAVAGLASALELAPQT